MACNRNKNTLLLSSNVTIERGMNKMDCKCGCGQQIEEKPGGHRQRLFFDDAHKMRWHRQQHQDDQHAALLAELAVLRAKVTDQAHTIEERSREVEKLLGLVSQLQDYRQTLEQENTTLKNRLDVERRYLEDIMPHTFKSWLKKQPSSPWRIRYLSDQLVPARGSRTLYQAHMKRLNMSDEEMEDFIRLWKLMLLQS